MDKSFQDYSRIQDFEADFQENQPQNPELGRLYCLSDLFAAHIWAIDHLNFKLIKAYKF